MAAKPAFYNVCDYGATGMAEPGETLELRQCHHPQWHNFPPGLKAVIYRPAPGKEYDSVGIQKAIDAAHQAGGGMVIVPAGDYLIGPIELKSGVNLHLSGGARLWGSPYLQDYEGPQGEAAPVYAAAHAMHKAEEKSAPRQRRLVSATDAQNISLTGSGQISGQSPNWFIPWYNSGSTDTATLERPAYSFIFKNCRRVLVEGVRILDSTSWSLVIYRCEKVQIRGIELRNMDIMNGDGIDIVDSSDVHVSDSHLHMADDGIVLKSHSPDHAVRNITVTNCIIRTLCNGIKIGTETVGTFEDITISNLVIHNQPHDVKAAGRGAWSGINLNTMDGGLVRNVNISNIVMRNVESAFFLLVGCRPQLQQPYRPPQVGRMERISLSNIQVDGCRYTAYAAGFPGHPIRQLHLSNISVHKTADFYAEKPQTSVQDHPDHYPHPYRFGSRQSGDQLPAHALYLRHVSQVTVRDFEIDTDQPDAREAFVVEHCSAFQASGLRTNGAAAELRGA